MTREGDGADDGPERSGESGRGIPTDRRLSLGYFLPALGRLRSYDGGKARGDLVAGAVVAVLLVPQAVAYAQLATLPAQAGLYASMLPLVVYALMGARATLSIGPVALVSLLVADAIAGAGELEPEGAAALLALVVGVLLLVAGLLRLGFLVRFVSEPVVKGFTAAAAVLIALSQLGAMLGIELERGALPTVARSLADEFGALHLPTLAVSAAALLAFVLGGRPWAALVRRFAAEGTLALVLEKSAPLAVIVAFIVAAALGGWAERFDIETVGALEAGFPPLAPPPLDPAAATAMLPSALAIAAIVFVVATGIADSLGGSGGERTTPDREAIALGAANAAAACSGGYAVGASFSRSALAANAGAASAFALAVTAALVLAVVLVAGAVFAHLPRAVLGALIVSAVWSLIDVRAMRRVWRFSRAEALTLFLTTAAVLLGGLRIGVAAGALAGLALYLHGTSRPRLTLEGRVAGSDALRALGRDDVEDAGPDGWLVVRVDESLYFGNAGHVRRSIVEALEERPDVDRVLLDMKSVDHVDYTALETLESLVDELDRRGVALRLVAVREPVWKTLGRFGLLDRCGGPEGNYETEEEALGAMTEARG